MNAVTLTVVITTALVLAQIILIALIYAFRRPLMKIQMRMIQEMMQDFQHRTEVDATNNAEPKMLDVDEPPFVF